MKNGSNVWSGCALVAVWSYHWVVFLWALGSLISGINLLKTNSVQGITWGAQLGDYYSVKGCCFYFTLTVIKSLLRYTLHRLWYLTLSGSWHLIEARWKSTITNVQNLCAKKERGKMRNIPVIMFKVVDIVRCFCLTMPFFPWTLWLYRNNCSELCQKLG